MARYLLHVLSQFSLFLPLRPPSHLILRQANSVGTDILGIRVHGSLESYIVGPRVLVTVTCRLILHKLATSAQFGWCKLIITFAS